MAMKTPALGNTHTPNKSATCQLTQKSHQTRTNLVKNIEKQEMTGPERGGERIIDLSHFSWALPVDGRINSTPFLSRTILRSHKYSKAICHKQDTITHRKEN
jgi:hypothetical protein